MTKSQKTGMAQNQSSLRPDGWHIVRFGDVAKKINTTIDREKCDLDRFVAGEHMQTDDFRIKEWGIVDEGYLGPAFNHKFTKGQILYGSRRTYLRKVSIPHFDGICANTTFVIEPVGDDLVPDLLPFIMQSAGFNEHSIRMSKGSTNPYINWKDIACYEFAIPDRDEQRRIATTLWAAEDCIVKGERFVAAAERAKQVLMQELFSGRKTILSKNWKNVKFSQIVESYKNGIYKTHDFYGSGLPSIRMFNIVEGKINKINAPLLNVTEKELKEYQLLEGDILINRVNSVDLIGKAGIVRKELGDVTYESKNIRVRVNRELIIPEYLIQFLQTSNYFRQIRMKNKMAIGQATVNQTDLADIELFLPPLPEQRQIADILTRCDETIAAARANVTATKALKMRLINEMLNPEKMDNN